MNADLEEIVMHVEMDEKDISLSTYQSKQSDTWIVGLHGLQSCKEIYPPIFAAPWCSEYSLLAIDAVGFGKSDKPDWFSYDIADQALAYVQIVDQLNIQKMHLVGHSWGGMAGIMLLEKLGDRVLSFVSMEGNMVASDCGKSRSIAMEPSETFAEIGYPKILNEIQNEGKSNAAQRVEWLSLMPPSVFHRAAQSVVQWSESGKLLPKFIDAPQKKYFIYGEKNQRKKDVLPASIPNIEIANAGHFMLADNFEDTAKAIESCISKS